MRDLVLHVPTDIRVDLELPGPDGWEFLASHAPPNGKFRRGELLCENGGDIYLAHRPPTNDLFGIHFDASDHEHRVTKPESDEHKRLIEYGARGVESHGITVDLNKELTTGTRPDAVFHGPQLDVGFEAQLAPITVRSVIDRTNKATDAGLATSVWTTPKPFSMGRRTSPVWAYQAPSIGLEDTSWMELPKPDSVHVWTGMRRIIPVRCDVFARLPCPNGPRPCGKWHPGWEPSLKLTLDDALGRLAFGLLVPMRFSTTKASHVILTNRPGIALYEELTGQPVGPLYLTAENSSQPRIDRGDGRLRCQIEHFPKWYSGPFVQPALWEDVA